MRRVAIITGTGLYELDGRSAGAVGRSKVQVDTSYGPLDVAVHEGDALTLFHVSRHGWGHSVPPHRLDPRRTVDAIARCRVDAVLSLQNTGGLRPNLKPGHVVVPHDLIDLGNHEHHTFFDDEAVHIDLSLPYCPTMRGHLITSLKQNGWTPEAMHERGVYIGTRGPRFETPAESAYLGRLGDIVGMTGATEAALARERGLCYAALAFVANPAAGVAGATRTAEQIKKALADEAPRLERVLLDAAGRTTAEKECGCADALRGGRLANTAQTTQGA